MNKNITSLFGTDGIRTRVGTAPFTFPELFHLADALGRWIADQQTTKPSIIIARDTRASGQSIQAAFETILLAHNIDVFDAGVVPTPLLYHYYQQRPYDVAIMITASHNAAHDNGLKIFYRKKKLTEHEEQEISKRAQTTTFPALHSFGKKIALTDCAEWYQEKILHAFPTPFLYDKKIVVDCAHGAWSALAQKLFESVGAQVIMIHHQPDGLNINRNCGSLHPQALAQTVLAHQADAGVAFDGDGDRVVMVNKIGQILNGDHLLSFLTEHPAYAQQPEIVGTIMTNAAVKAHCTTKNITLHRTPVGDKHIAQHLEEHNLLLGGEPSGHLILRDFVNCADGLFTALRVLETATLTHNWSFSTHDNYPHSLTCIPVTHKKSLTVPPLSTLIEETEKKIWPGRLVVRYSGTEPVLRLLVEAAQAELVQQTSSFLQQELTTLLAKE